MWEGTESIEIAAPPEKVWAIAADVDRHVEIHGSGEIKSIRTSGPMRVGATWEADERIKGAGSFTARSECVQHDEPRVFSWKSYPPPLKKGNPDSVADVQWWFRLSPSGAGTRVEHAFRVVEPKVGRVPFKIFYALTRRANTIRKGMRKTLQNLKAAAEG